MSRETFSAPLTGLSTRAATADDADFQRELFATDRRAELLASGLPELVAESLVDVQYRGFQASLAARQVLEDQTWLLDEVPVGRVVLGHADDEIRIVWIAVRPDRRGRGLGAALLTPTLAWADVTGRRLTLSVDPLNRNARALYEALGFEPDPAGAADADAVADLNLIRQPRRGAA